MPRGNKLRVDRSILKSVRYKYYCKTLADAFELLYNHLKEGMIGLDYTIFDKTILYYQEVRGVSMSHEKALARALSKKGHKAAWFTKQRNTVEDMLHFYKEVDFYPFMQPYLKRFGGFRWYVHLVDHVAKPSILEYGCGSAVLTEYLIEKFPKFDFTVADIPSVTLDFVNWKKERFNYDYTILTIGPGKEGIPLIRNYDLIICQDVLEHTPNPLEIVTSFVNHLSPAGVLVIDSSFAPLIGV